MRKHMKRAYPIDVGKSWYLKQYNSRRAMIHSLCGFDVWMSMSFLLYSSWSVR